LKFTLGALQQLTAEAQVIRHRGALPLIDGRQACRHLGSTLEKFREKGTTVKLDRPKLNVQQVWSTFAAARFELNALNGLEFRTLCSAEETALRPEFIAALVRNPAKLKRSRCLYGLVNNYFSGWRAMQNPSSVENLLRSAFTSYEGRNPVVQKWSTSTFLFSSEAASSLAEVICSEQKGVDDALKTHYVGPLTKLGLMARTSATISAGQNFRQLERSHNEEWSLRYIQWMIEKLFSDLTSPEAFSATVSLLITSESAKRSEVFRRALRAYIQSHKKLGDPRLRESSPNWRSMAPEAAQRYLSWLARDSIIFFFNTILPDTSENRRRKEFWLRYHDCIKDFQVAVSEEDVWKIKSGHTASELISYSQVAHATTSAFLMQFEGYGAKFLIVEFSETGNAAYIFKLADFEALGVTLRTPRFELKKHLKYDKTHRIIHNGQWEVAANYLLSSEFGIRP
jgi:hypothetical protein